MSTMLDYGNVHISVCDVYMYGEPRKTTNGDDVIGKVMLELTGMEAVVDKEIPINCQYAWLDIPYIKEREDE